MATLVTRYILALIVIALLTQIPGLAVAEITGPARVIDGDTIVIHDTKIRLHGVDAPESAQAFRAKSINTTTSMQKQAIGAVVALITAGEGDSNRRYGFAKSLI